MSPAVPVRLTCQTCARRKVKCDKKSPCTNCLKTGIPCVAVERPCRPRGRSGKQTTSREDDLSNRVAKLEQKLQDLIQSERGSTLNVPSSSSEAIPLQTGGSRNRPSKNAQTTDGSSAQILPPADNRDDAPGSGIATHTTRHEHHVGNPWEPLSEPVRRKILLDIYLHQVDPILKILHRPSLCSYLMEGKSYLGYPREHPVPAALASAVLYMASSIISEDQCLALLAERKETVLTRHKDDAKTALAKVDFLVTTDLTVLQAFVLSLVAARTHDHSRRAWTMLSVALRIAQGLSLHKTDPPCRATPFEREMRRRLWQVIGWLDLEVSLNRGSECMMRSAWLMSHTLTNVNDDAFELETEEPLPVAQSGQSEATLLMIFAHGQCALRALDLSHFIEPAVTDIRNRQQIVDQFRYTADGLLAGSDPENIAFHWFTKRVKEQISGVLQLIALRPFQTSPSFVPAEIPGHQILALATEILQRRQTLYNDPRSQPWRWIEPLFFPWHALLVAITEKQAVAPDCDWLITSMENLMCSARAARQSAFAKDAPEDNIAPHSHFYMEMSSLGNSILPVSLPAGFPAISTEIQELSQIQDYEGIEWAQYVDFGNSL